MKFEEPVSSHGDYRAGNKRRYIKRRDKMSNMTRRTNFSRGNTQNLNNPEEFAIPLWDRVHYPAAGIGSVNFFSNAIGAQVTLLRSGVAVIVGKTKRDTNLSTPNQIAVNKRTVEGISLYFIPASVDPTATTTDDIAEDIQNVLNGGYVTFKIGEKLVFEAPLNLIPSFAGVSGVAATSTTAVTTTSSIVGVQNRTGSGIYPLRTPITLNPNSPFTFVCDFDGLVTVSQPFDLQICLHGVVLRPS